MRIRLGFNFYSLFFSIRLDTETGFRLGAQLIQSFFAESLWEEGLGRSTFQVKSIIVSQIPVVSLNSLLYVHRYLFYKCDIRHY
jgi:hypothetical protein